MTQTANGESASTRDASPPPRLVEGVSAYRAARQMLVVALVASGLFVLWVPVVIVTDLPARPTLFPLLALALVALAALVFVLSLRMSAAIARERRAGYTTTYSPKYDGLWQLDPDSGDVLRRPGEHLPRSRTK